MENCDRNSYSFRKKATIVMGIIVEFQVVEKLLVTKELVMAPIAIMDRFRVMD